MPSKISVSPGNSWEGIFSGAAGLWLGLALIKLGNPVILDQQIQAPASREELLLHPWPLAWGYALLAAVVFLSLRFWRWHTPVPTWLVALPLLWLGWQGLSALQTVDRALTATTLKHFGACVTAFYVGLFAFSRLTRVKPFWIGLLGGFLVVLLVGWRQHFGGLEETRRYFFSLPDWQTYPPEFLKKVSSDRIYSTLFYPNTLAGVVILLLPISLATLWETGRPWPVPAKLAGACTIGLLGLGCLYWSGSKAGWLIALGQGVMVLLHSKLKKTAKMWVLGVIILAGLAGFWLKYQGYFEGGATSVSARFDYWKAAWQTLLRRPLLGSGPGTFMVSYKALKPPEAEMTRLAHNDFLQQASDSGWVGLLAYTGWFAGGCGLLYRRSARKISPECFGMSLGLGGAMLQGFVEFGLYVPALSWTTFFLLGWSLGSLHLRNSDAQPSTSPERRPHPARRRVPLPSGGSTTSWC